MRKRQRRDDAYRVGGCTLRWKPDGTPVAEYREGTARRRIAIGKPGATLDQAQAALAKFAEGHGIIRAHRAKRTVRELWHLWMTDRAKDGFRNNIYMQNWKALAPMFADRTPETITSDDCRVYARQRFALGLSSWTVYTEIVRLRGCLRWAAESDLIPKAPKIWAPPRGEPRQHVITAEQARELLRCAGNPHVELFIMLALTTGARHAAILDLTWDRVDFERGTITYEETEKSKDPMSKSWTKGRATVPIGPALRERLVIAHRGSLCDHVIEHGGHRIKSCREGFAAAVRRAGLPDWLTPHVIRHSVATWARHHGREYEEIAKLLGHEDSRTTELVYTHVDAAKVLLPTVTAIDAEFEEVKVGKKRGTR